MNALPEKVADALAGVIEERTRDHRLFRRNACLHHGIPLEDEVPKMVVEHKHEHAVLSGASAVTVVDKPGPPKEAAAPGVPEVKSRVKPWMKYVAAALAGGGLVGAPALGWHLWKGGGTVVEEKPGSLFQYLEDNGWHIDNRGSSQETP